MKREIKFRGRNYDGMWMYGYLMPAPKPTIHLDCDYSISVSPSALKSVDRMLYEVETNTIGQYTGLKDKNGKEIYEGDIVKVPYLDPIFGGVVNDMFVNIIVGYNKGSFVLEYDSNLRVYISDLYDNIEIIGNIHDNPELLKGE